jgi:putative endonuclease
MQRPSEVDVVCGATYGRDGAYSQGRARMQDQRDGDGPTEAGSGSHKAAPTTTTDTQARRRLGSSGERLAARWLEARGYRILGSNWRCAYGELDIIAEQDGELVFVEVKTRRGETLGLPEEAITASKQKHLIAAAQSYLEAAGIPEQAYRIDVVAVQLAPNGKLLDVRHYERAVGMDGLC